MSGHASTLCDFASYCQPSQRDIRQGERSGQDSNAALAHSVDLSVWHTLQAFGIFRVSVSPGVTK
jgi:hypothetical protein